MPPSLLKDTKIDAYAVLDGDRIKQMEDSKINADELFYMH